MKLLQQTKTNNKQEAKQSTNPRHSHEHGDTDTHAVKHIHWERGEEEVEGKGSGRYFAAAFPEKAGCLYTLQPFSYNITQLIYSRLQQHFAVSALTRDKVALWAE